MMHLYRVEVTVPTWGHKDYLIRAENAILAAAAARNKAGAETGTDPFATKIRNAYRPVGGAEPMEVTDA
jgi:hypothetical protein